MTTVWERLGDDAKAALPWLESLFKTVAEDEVTALAPLVQEAITEIGGDVSSYAGNPVELIAMVGGVLSVTGAKALALGMQVGITSLGTAVLAGVSKLLADLEMAAAVNETQMPPAASGATAG